MSAVELVVVLGSVAVWAYGLVGCAYALLAWRDVLAARPTLRAASFARRFGAALRLVVAWPFVRLDHPREGRS